MQIDKYTWKSNLKSSFILGRNRNNSSNYNDMHNEDNNNNNSDNHVM